MSYILEALKKVDQERGIGAVPDLATPHEARRAQPRSYRWLWIFATLLSVNVAVLFLLLKDRGAGSADLPVREQAPPQQQTASVNAPPEQAPQQASPARIVQAPAPQQAVVPEKQSMVAAGELVVLPEPAYLQDSRTSTPPEEETASRTDAETTTQDPSQVQNWYELPDELRNKLDLPRVDIHVYSEQPARRYILVNLEKYREGERLPSGLLLEEILPDGMIMSYNGERFRVEK